MQVFDNTLELLEKGLGLRLVRHNIISSNLANMDTPGYQAQDINFEAELERAMDVVPVKVGDNALPEPGPRVHEEGPVDLDREMSRLAENTLMHDALGRLIGKKFEMLKYAITEGGK